MRLKESLKSSFLAGVVLVAPLVVTLVVLRFLSDILAGQLEPIVEGTRLAQYTANNHLLAQLLALAVILVVVTLLGAFAKRPVGQRTLGKTGRLVGFVPVFRTIYGSVKQMASSVSTRSSDFDAAVFVEYERDGLYRLGLQTGQSPAGVEDVAGEPALNVFVPGSPNPTQGALLLVPESRVYESGLSVRAAIRILMTTGMTEGSHDDDLVDIDGDEFPDAVRGVGRAADAGEGTGTKTDRQRREDREASRDRSTDQDSSTTEDDQAERPDDDTPDRE